MTQPADAPPAGPAADGEEPPRFEDLLSSLEAVVGRLERGELPLEDALAAFEEGMGLIRSAGAILDAAEARVQVLLEQRDGSLVEAPLDP